jgi:adenosylmethionine-8-amino-7-oxononanoate aminotransferase
MVPRNGAASELVAHDLAHLWHPFTPQGQWREEEPLIIERGEGCWLIDIEGRRYLDGVSSLWCNVHGHRHPRIDQAIREQLERVAHTTLLGVTHPSAIRLARRLVELAPAGLTRVFFSDDGATAVEVALKMAFQYWRQLESPQPARTRFVALGGAYHGDTIGDVSLGGVERFHSLFGPLLFGTIRAPMPHCYRCPLGLDSSTCAMDCAAALEDLLEKHRGKIAAVVVEPLVQGAAGMITHPPGYLRRLREMTLRHDTLLVADEVAVGLGRTGTLFACEQEQVSPDFLCLAKGLTGGYLPLAATLTTERVHGAFLGTRENPKTFFHGHTYSGNPLGAAAALATLEIFEEEETLARMAPKMELVRARLEAIGRIGNVGDVRQRGLVAGIELVADRATKAPYPPAAGVGSQVCRRARALGVLIRPLGDVVVVMPPLSIDLGELGMLLDVVESAISEVTRGETEVA